VSQVAIGAVQAMLAPVVLMTTCAILAGGIQTMYAEVNDRMRMMTAERLSRLQSAGPNGELAAVASLRGAARERIAEIDAQLPLLLARHRKLHSALMCVYQAVLMVVGAMVLIAASISVPAPAAGDVALVLILAATVTLLFGVAYVAASVRKSAGAVDYEVRRVLQLGL
jgi:Protein of unknown function (DUF2721)